MESVCIFCPVVQYVQLLPRCSGVDETVCCQVGVQGDERSYCSAVALTGKRDWDLLFRLARLIPKEVHCINRVVYAFNQDDVDEVPFTITPTHLQHAEVAQLQLADEIVNDELFKHDLVRSLSQVPVILFVSVVYTIFP